MKRYRPVFRRKTFEDDQKSLLSHPHFCEKSFFIIFVVFETSSRDEYHLNVK